MRLLPSQQSYLSPRFHHLVHVIRSPYKQISAFTTHLPSSYHLVHAVLNMTQLINDDLREEFNEAAGKQAGCPRGWACNLHFSTLAWIYWNRHIERYANMSFMKSAAHCLTLIFILLPLISYADSVHRVEEFDKLLDFLCEILWPKYSKSKTTLR